MLTTLALLFLIAYDTPIEKEIEIEMVVNEMKKYQLHRLHDASYGAMLSAENLYNGYFNDYPFLYIELPVSTHRQCYTYLNHTSAE